MAGFKFFPTAFAGQLERLTDSVFAGLDLLVAFPAFDTMPVQRSLPLFFLRRQLWGREINFAKEGCGCYNRDMGKQKLVEYFEEVETKQEYNGYFCSVSQKQSVSWCWEAYADYAISVKYTNGRRVTK